MPLTSAEIEAIGVAVWNSTFGEPDNADVAVMLQRAYHHSVETAAKVDALTVKVAALTSGSPLAMTDAQLIAALKQAQREGTGL